MLELAHETGVWRDFVRLGASFGRARPCSFRQALVAAKRWKQGTWMLGAEADVAAHPHLRIELRDAVGEVRIWKAAATRDVLDGWIALCRGLHEALAALPLIWKGSIDCLDVRYPQRRPPLWHELHRFGTLVDIVNTRALQNWLPAAQEPVRSAALPAGASRITDGDLTILRWIEDPATPVAQAIGCIRQEEWWARHIEPQVPMGWNAAGDRRVDIGELVRRSPFTLLDETSEIGYLAVVVQPDGSLAGTTWAEIEKLAADHTLRLLVPVRDNAVAIGERARAAGVDAVLYREDDELWDPLPRGEWRDPKMSLAEIERRLHL